MRPADGFFCKLESRSMVNFEPSLLSGILIVSFVPSITFHGKQASLFSLRAIFLVVSRNKIKMREIMDGRGRAEGGRGQEEYNRRSYAMPM